VLIDLPELLFLFDFLAEILILLLVLSYHILTSPKETVINITKISLINSTITCGKSQFSSGHLAFSLLEIGHVDLASEVHEHFLKKKKKSSGFYSYICNC